MVLSAGQTQMAHRFRARGLSLRQVAREVGCSYQWVRLITCSSDRTSRSEGWVPRAGRLQLSDREEISLGLHGGETLSAIATRLNRAVSMVSREVAANGGRGEYRAWRAHQRARQQGRRPKSPKLDSPALAAQVTDWLEDFWSPEEISRRLRIEFADDPMMQVSHETIYQSLFVQGRGELRRELTRCLRTGRAKRRPKHRPENTGRLRDMVMISERPPEVEDRAVPGHWEGDLIMGKNSKSAVGTLVERSTRYVLLLHLPNGRSALDVEKAMREAITALPAELVRTVTWDQGKEMAHHANFTVATGVPVYFCDPHSPWQRGSNENTNGLLRQYMPKGIDLSTFSGEDLARFAQSLNNRPRKTLGYMKPSEKLAELLALTG
jgi:transposase, IS30 family